MTTIGRAAGALAAGCAAFAAAGARAQDAEGGSETGGSTAPVIGQSAPGQLDIQEMVTPIGYAMADLHHMMLWIITGITIFVLALLVIVIVRYNAAANPTPARWTHNTPLEILWTTAPVIILVIIAIPSVRLLQLQEDFTRVEPDIVIKTTGFQWAWSYEYVNEGISFDSYMLGLNQAEMNEQVRDELAAAGYPERAWRLATDTAMVVPVGATVLMQVTARDVIHSWTIPAFAVKADGVPGRINQQWFRAEREGIYFGQCSELCGRNHSYMPITVKVVSQQEYDAWVECVRTNGIYECPSVTMNEFIERQEQAAAGGASELAEGQTTPVTLGGAPLTPVSN